MSLGIKIPKDAFKAGREKFASGEGDYNDVELEPGRYVGIVTKGRAVDTKNGPSVVLDIEVAGESDKKGGRISVWYALAEERIVWLFRVLALLGYEVDNLDEKLLTDILADIETNTPVVRFKASRAGDFINYRVEKLLPELTAASARGGAVDSGTEVAADPEAGAVTAGAKPGSPKAAAGKPAKAPAKAAAPPVEEAPPSEEEPEGEPEATGDDLDGMDRNALKKVLVTETIAFKVMKNHSDDDIRTAIRTARAAAAEPEAPAEEAPPEEVAEEPEPEAEVTVGMKVKATIRGEEHQAEITAIHEAEGKVTIKSLKDKKLYKIAVDKLTA